MVACYSRKIQTLRVNNSIILRTKNAKFSEYYFHLNTNIYGDFQICISVPLKPHVVVFVFTVFSFHSFPFFLYSFGVSLFSSSSIVRAAINNLSVLFLT